MIIVSQDKDVIINFENVLIININQTKKTQIGGWFSCNEENNNNVLLGEYATEERAKEVLNEIIKAFVTEKKLSSQDNMFGFTVMPSNTYYEMPKK